MSFPQLKSSDGRVVLEVGERRVHLVMEGARIAGFDVRHETVVSTSRAEELRDLDPAKWLIAFRRSSPAARTVLREAGLSYACADGEIYVHAPPVHVEVPRQRRSVAALAPERTSPFAIRASRIPRWLLIHLDDTPSFGQLGATLDLSASLVSRTVRALADEAFVTVSSDPVDARLRRVGVRNPGEMLTAFERAWSGRRTALRTWDVGSRDVEKTLSRLRRSAQRTSLPYAIGGLAGASFVKRVVEPSSVDVWIQREDLDVWVDELTAVEARPSRGTVTFRAAPDVFVFSLGDEREGLRIADPVQLFLDCRLLGERAIDAAESIRREMGW